ESDEEFAATRQFVDTLNLSYLHVFPYSKRPNTAAARMPGHVDGEVIKDRAASLRALSKTMAERYARQFVGRSLPVVWEKDVDAEGRRLGHARNSLTVVAPVAASPAPGSLTMTRLKGFVAEGRLLGVP